LGNNSFKETQFYKEM